MKRIIAIYLGCAALSACLTPIGTSNNVQQRVYQAEGAFSAALSLAVAYEALPPCTAGVKAVCADPAVVSKVTASARLARTALKGAEDAVRAKSAPAQAITAVTDAEQAVAAFQALVPQVKVP